MMRGMRMRGGVKPQDVGRTVRRLMSYVARYRLRLVLVVLCIILSAVASVLSSTFIGVLIDDYISPLLLQANPVFTGLARALGVMVCVYVVGMISGYFYNRLMVTVAQGVLKDVRDEMFAHMQTLPIRYFDTHSHGEVMSHFTNDTDTLRQMIAQALPQVLSSVVSLVAVVCAMLSLSLWLTLFVLAFAVLMLYITKRVSGQSGKYFVKQQQSLADVNGYIEEMINGQKVVKVFCHEQKAVEEFDRRNDELCRNATAANKFANILGPVNNNLGHLLYVLLAVVGAAMSLAGLPNVGLSGAGTITLGMIASFMTLSRSFVMPLSQVSQQLSSVIMALAGAERIFHLMDEPSEHDDGYVTLVNARRENGQLVESQTRTGLWAWKHPHHDGTVTYTELKGDIVLDDVDFGYVPDKTVLHNISLYAKPGQKIAFVGATGAGKTTITNLINRFYDIDSGDIFIDGINIRDIQRRPLRLSLGMVLQDVYLFAGTIRANIAYGRPDATDEQIHRAAKLANCEEFIERLPQGYDTIVGERGLGLSGGQKQRIAIARALLYDPAILVLDDSTSAVDMETEHEIQRHLKTVMKDRTTFIIAHRISSVKNADQILVLDKSGRIAERGTHDELLAKRGLYYDMYQDQYRDFESITSRPGFKITSAPKEVV